jgi:hypothetical protein
MQKNVDVIGAMLSWRPCSSSQIVRLSKYQSCSPIEVLNDPVPVTLATSQSTEQSNAANPSDGTSPLVSHTFDGT